MDRLNSPDFATKQFILKVAEYGVWMRVCSFACPDLVNQTRSARSIRLHRAALINARSPSASARLK